MPKILVTYYSKTGNTKMMAEAIAEGARSVGGIEVIVKDCGSATNNDLLEADCIVIGSPTYFRLVAWPLKKFIDESIAVYRQLRGKMGGVFTSSGTEHDGKVCLQSLRDMLDEHGVIIVGEGVLALRRPMPSDLEACRKYGRELASRICGG
jgi:NAD(P)H dehydrogenase (quinone)